MQYAILIYENETDFSARTDKERQGPYWAGWRAYSQALAESGGHHRNAAKLLGISSRTLSRKLKLYGMGEVLEESVA